MNQTFFNLFRTAVLLGLCLSAASAATITITNPSFEDPAQGQDGFTDTSPTGWNLTGIGGVWYAGTNYFNSTPDGNQILYLGYLGTEGDLTQSLGVSLEANTTYNLTFYVGQRLATGLGDYNVSLLAGTNVLATDNSGTPDSGNFTFRTITFDSGATPVSGELTIAISSTFQGQTAFDLFSLTTSATSATPEPGTIALFGTGLGAIAILRRRRSR